MKKIQNIFVNRVLNSIENISKVCMLSPFPLKADFSLYKIQKKFSFWNLWTICGFLGYSSYHIFHVIVNNYNHKDQSKWVIHTIDTYNKFVGVLLYGILVLLTYLRQNTTAHLNKIFCEIDDIIRNKMGIDINNMKTQRCFYIQVNLLVAAIIISEQNCLMYINLTSLSSDICMLFCLFPMITTAVFECRIFAYFLLIRERLAIINITINSLKNDLEVNESSFYKNENVFFIASELGSFKINEKFTMPLTTTKWIATKSRLNFFQNLKLKMQREWQLMKLIFTSDDKEMYVNDLEATKHHRITHANYHMKLLKTIQIIYTKLHIIPNLISTAFGIQIIAIISVQFITLTTLMYTFAMKITRILTVKLSEHEINEIHMDIWTSLCWICLFIYKLFSICYSVHVTKIEDQKVGHNLHHIGLKMNNINHKLKVKLILPSEARKSRIMFISSLLTFLKVKLFLLQYLQRSKNFTPCGLVDIDFGLFTMIVGVVTTYILILIQFDVSQT